MDRVRLRRCAIALAAIAVAIGGVFRAQPAAAEPRHFAVPAGEAAQTLVLFGHQADRFISYDFSHVQHQLTQGIDGDFEIADALRFMLNGSGLDFHLSDSGSVFVNVIEPTADASALAAHPGSNSLKVGEGPRPVQRPLETVYVSYTPEAEEEQAKRGAVPTNTSVEAVTLDAKDIEQSGAQNVPDLMRPITFNFGGGATEDTQVLGREAPTNTAYGSGLNLRGLGSRATLVLVDGFRLAPSGSSGLFFDISNIPLSAIQQIQVISDGDSTLLGEDAIGGIVNLQLRGSGTAPETRASFGGFGKSSLGEQLFSQSVVGHWDSGGGLLAAEYYDRDALFASERSQATSDLTPWGGSNFGSPTGNPGTLVTTLPDGTQQFFGIPAGQNGTGLKASQLTAGPLLHDLFQGTTVLPHQQRLSVIGTGDLKLSDDLILWGDALVSRRRVKDDSAGLTAALSIPTTNPWYVNPVPGSSVQVLYGFGPDLGSQTLEGEVYSGQLAGGATYAITSHWNVNGYLSYAGEYQRDIFGNLVNFTALQPYLNSSDPSTAFNAFGDGSYTNPTTLAAIRSQRYAHYRSAYYAASLTASGSVLTLPMGDVAVTFGTDYRYQTFASALSPTDSTAASTFAADRHMTALYAQGIVPLMGPDDSKRHPHRLELSAGVRDERYSDVGNALAPQLGLTFWATPSVSVRAGWAKLFRPPDLSDLSEASNVSTIAVLPDTHGLTNALVWTGGNNDLRPESAQNLTGGFTVSPVSLPDLSVSATYFHTIFDQIIQSIDLPATVLQDPQYSWLVSRDVTAAQRAQVCAEGQFVGTPSDCLNAPVGALVDVRLHNAATLKTDGIDIASRYVIHTPRGQLKLGVDSTYVLRYAEANTPTSPITSYLSTAHYPIAFRAKATTGWETRNFWTQAVMNYQGGYEDTDSVPRRPISPWSTWDVSAGYRLGNVVPEFSDQIQLIASALNVFNRQPPFLNNAVEELGYDEENGDLLGRRVSIQIRVKW
jgi:iron complex outermembrane recepter protein